MKNDKNKNFRKPNLMLRFAGGVYLVWLGWDMTKQYMNDPNKEEKLFFLIAAIFFALVGLAFAISAFRRYYAETMASYVPDESEAEEGAPSALPEEAGVSDDGEEDYYDEDFSPEEDEALPSQDEEDK